MHISPSSHPTRNAGPDQNKRQKNKTNGVSDDPNVQFSFWIVPNQTDENTLWMMQ
jgi:hypothetical protein